MQATSTRRGCEPQQLLDGFKPPLISLQLFHQASQFFHPSNLLICKESEGAENNRAFPMRSSPLTNVTPGLELVAGLSHLTFGNGV